MPQDKPRTVAFHTLGCKVNQYDTDAMRCLMEDAGFVTVPFNGLSDIYVINTCTVTHISDRKSRQMIARAHKLNPNAVIVVAGCYSKVSENIVKKLPGVSIVLGTDDRQTIVSAINNYMNNDCIGVNSENRQGLIFEPLSANTEEKTRAFLKLQDGCNRYCSYCIIPYARGNPRSRPIENAKAEMSRLNEMGYGEVVLTGVHLMSYGLDLGCSELLAKLLDYAEQHLSIPRIRLGSIDPDFVTDEFLEAVNRNKRVCRHFHLSLQSGSASVLQRMNRRYTPDDYRATVEKLRKLMPECAITTDIIAGFPGESGSEHNETVDFVREIGFSRIHIFPYSAREGTPAAKMPNQIAGGIKNERVSELLELADELQYKYAKKLVGHVAPVLVEERVGVKRFRGLTENYIETHIFIDDNRNGEPDSLVGKIVNVVMEDVCDKTDETPIALKCFMR